MFSDKKIFTIKILDEKLLLMKLQWDGKGSRIIKTVRGVLRPAFQMAVDDDVLYKNLFGFERVAVIVNDSVMREVIARD